MIDSFEPHAEAMLEAGVWKCRGAALPLLFALERAMAHHAQALIAAAPAMTKYGEQKYVLHRGALPVKPACVDLDRFHPRHRGNEALRRELGLQDKIVCVCAGKFGGIYLEDEVFTLLAAAYAQWGDRFRVLLLTSHAPETLATWAARAHVPAACMVVRFVSHAAIPQYMGLADFALTPVKPAASKRACSPIKDGEYWALGLPVIITEGISNDSELIEHAGCGVLWRDYSAEGCRATMAAMAALLAGDRAALGAKSRRLAEEYRSFEIARRVYADVYGS